MSRVIAGRALWRGRLEPIEIGIDDDGVIAAIAKDLRGAPRRDYGEKVLLPSFTDLHVHFREPGPPDAAEDVAHGTVQAALGGVGLVGDMPNTEPPTDRVDRLNERIARAAGRLAVDLVVYATPTRLAEVPRLGRLAGSFKLYLGPTTGLDTPVEPEMIPAVLAAVASTELPLVVHAEDPGQFVPGPPPTSTAAWDAARPVAAELAGIDRVDPAPPSLRLHIAHVTSPTTVERLRNRGVSFEATPHHLLASTDRCRTGRWKVNPPIRSEAERAQLWEAFAAGAIPILASDHAPHPLTAKDGPFALAPSGVPGVETMVPLLLQTVKDGRLPLSVLQSAGADRPARWLGRPHGRLAVGHLANLLVVDFRAVVRLAADRLHAPCGWTPYEGWPAIFPSEHYHRGTLIVSGGEFLGERHGSVVRPSYREEPPTNEAPEPAGALRR